MGESDLVAYSLTIAGMVQGVGFRYSTTATARRLGVGGWVRNCPDGSVEALIVGSAAKVNRMAMWIGHGPPGARVLSVQKKQVPVSGTCKPFSIRY